MNYEFPEIVHIQQVLDAIKGDEDLFYVVEKDGYTVVNYKLPCNKTFPPVTDRNTAIRRELRGIKFDNETGKTIARPYHKFHNFGEREETLAKNIDLSNGYDRLEKLDGSMVHPITLGGGIRWSTKMGVTDTSMQVETWLAGNPHSNLFLFIKECQANFLTPIFEWCSRKNRIVVDHPEDRLVLTAIRGLFDGRYLSYTDLVSFGKFYAIEVVSFNNESIEDIESYAESIHNYSDGELTEGEVLRFKDGHMLKLKTKDYINLHRTKDKIQKERNLVAVMLGGGLDDLKPFMLAEDLAKAEAYETTLNQNIINLCVSINAVISKIKDENISRKDFALGSKAPPIVKQIVFHLWDKEFSSDLNVSEQVMKRLVEACETDQKFDKIKPIVLKGCEW